MSWMRISIICFLFFVSGKLLGQEHTISSIIQKYDESNVVLAPDGKTLYFTLSHHVLNRGGKNDEGDIWYSIFNGTEGWSEPMRINGPINNLLNNRVLGFSPDGRIMYLHGTYSRGGQSASLAGISYSAWNGTQWTFPQPMSIPHFKNESTEQGGFISADGSVLLLSAHSYNSLGNEDIYVSFFDRGSWTEPKNLGPEINTMYQEFTPFLSLNKKVLFFSSNGRGGKGSSDVFYSVRQDDSWTNWSSPQPVKGEVNTEGKDFNFQLADQMQKMLWVRLTNSNEYGEILIAEPNAEFDSLFTERPVIEAEEPVKIIAGVFGTVFNQGGQPVPNCAIELRVNGQSITATTDQKGYYVFETEDSGVGQLLVDAQGYIPQNENVNLIKEGTIEQNFSLLPVAVGVTVNLKNVLFKRGTSELVQGSSESLNSVVKLMKDNPNLKIELGGHTDNTGIARKNVRLSKSRVRAVKKYLVNSGVESSRITGKGYGGAKPIASNASEQTRRLNRRVEFTIIGN